MKKILIAGNSHIGALKSGLIEFLSSNSHCANDHSFVFAGTTGAKDLVLDNRSLTVQASSARYQQFLVTTGGEKTLKLDEYHAIFLVGRHTPLDARHFFIKDFQPFSRAVISCVVRQIINKTFSRQSFYSHIIDEFPGKCFWIPNPCEPEGVNSMFFSAPNSIPRAFKRIRGTTRESLYLPLLDSGNKEDVEMLLSTASVIKEETISCVLSKNMKGVILPPAHTLKNEFVTLSKYSIGSRHFATDKLEPTIDPHMNSAYGAIIVSSIFASLNIHP